MLKKAVQMNLDDLWPFVAVQGGMFLLYQLVEAIILNTVKPDTSAAMCGIFLLAIGAVMMLFLGVMYPLLNVDMLLRYGVTRKTALAGTLITMAINAAVSMGLAALLGWADGFIAQAWVDALPWVQRVEVISQPPLWAYLVTGLGAVCLAFGVGSLLQKFGRKAFWLVWGGWMLLMVGIQVVDLDALVELPVFVPALGAACVIALAGGCGITLRATVKN